MNTFAALLEEATAMESVVSPRVKRARDGNV